MSFVRNAFKTGNSVAITIPKIFTVAFSIVPGTPVKLEAKKDGTIELRPLNRVWAEGKKEVVDG
jgi:antitoxin component of MazEF toxin-antitoxin module